MLTGSIARLCHLCVTFVCRDLYVPVRTRSDMRMIPVCAVQQPDSYQFLILELADLRGKRYNASPIDAAGGPLLHSPCEICDCGCWPFLFLRRDR